MCKNTNQRENKQHLHPQTNQETISGLQSCKCGDATAGVIVFPPSGDIVLLLAVGFIWDMRQTFQQLT